MSEIIKFTRNVNLDDYLLIIPSVSVGNIPQLTIDLIITTYKLEKIASLWHYGIIPSVGGNPFENTSNEICTACELYVNEELKLAVLQLRSKIDKIYANDFFNKLTNEIIQLKFNSIYILTSTFAADMHDVQSSKFRYISTEDVEEFAANAVLRMESVNDEYALNGGGFAVKLYNILSKKIKTTVLIKYGSEGDNRPDAIHTLDLLHKLVSNFKQDRVNQIVCPSSWEYVFGNPPPVGIY